MGSTDVDYKKRCLYRIRTDGSSSSPDMLESTWAYSYIYPGAVSSTPGRYRIRITKLTGASAASMFGVDPSDIEDVGSLFTVQAYLEKWTSEGWLMCLDWMGDPDDSNKKIEKSLNDMFESFITGVPLEEDIVTPIIRPRPESPRKEPVSPNVIPFAPIVENPSKKDDDMDWI